MKLMAGTAGIIKVTSVDMHELELDMDKGIYPFLVDMQFCEFLQLLSKWEIQEVKSGFDAPHVEMFSLLRVIMLMQIQAPGMRRHSYARANPRPPGVHWEAMTGSRNLNNNPAEY